MRVVANLLWLLFAGLWLAVCYTIAGIISCVLIITIPFGIQSFKLAGYALWPFGKVVIERPGADAALGCLGNGIWIITGGWWLALVHLITGVLLCVTII